MGHFELLVAPTATSPGEWHTEARIARAYDALPRVRELLAAVCRQVSPTLPPPFTGQLQLAVHEALTNVLHHGGPAEEPDIHLRFEADGGAVAVTVLYRGPRFTPGEVTLPPIESHPEGGFGLFIIRASVDEAVYDVDTDGRNRIRLVKRIPV